MMQPSLKPTQFIVSKKYRGLLKRTKTSRRRQPGETGYTLIELLIVLAILALLVGIATPMVLKYLNGAKLTTAHIQVDNLQVALDLFDQDMNRYPTGQEGLQALTADPGDGPGWHGPYIKTAASLKDPWGHAYNYRFPGQHKDYDLWSNGPHNGNDSASPEVSNW